MVEYRAKGSHCAFQLPTIYKLYGVAALGSVYLDLCKLPPSPTISPGTRNVREMKPFKAVVLWTIIGCTYHIYSTIDGPEAASNGKALRNSACCIAMIRVTRNVRSHKVVLWKYYRQRAKALLIAELQWVRHAWISMISITRWIVANIRDWSPWSDRAQAWGSLSSGLCIADWTVVLIGFPSSIISIYNLLGRTHIVSGLCLHTQNVLSSCFTQSPVK